ncbi:MAG: FMN-binding negative transcriptional regulator [Chitinophagaceae bacterium]|nr:FMN-binding negative transcriptional regulator [Chitinophagaceae bacterium]
MYNLPYFKEKDHTVVVTFMKQFPFAFLSGCDKNNKPVATQVPLLVEERGDKLIFHGHIMRQTDHHRAFEQNPDVLAVFTGPHTYVSATWYDNPHQASTWNYMSVHARGILRFTDEKGLEELLRKLTLHFENNNTHSTTVFDNLPAEYRQKLMKAIIAFEIEVTAIDNVFKLSQNRNEKSYHNIIEKLKAQEDKDAGQIADIMEQRVSKVFDEGHKENFLS